MKIINVTQEDIDNGLQGGAHACAIALAVERELNIKHLVAVGIGDYFSAGSDHYCMPRKARDFVKQFDHNKADAKPFSFALRKYKVKETVTKL